MSVIIHSMRLFDGDGSRIEDLRLQFFRRACSAALLRRLLVGGVAEARLVGALKRVAEQHPVGCCLLLKSGILMSVCQ